MIESKYRIGIFATIFAIIFTTLVNIWKKYSVLWLSLEVITLPLIYYIGYEILMNKQKEDLDRDFEELAEEFDSLSETAQELREENKTLKRKLRKN